MKSLIVGMGIGNLYKDVLAKLGHDIVTVDMDAAKHADYTDIVTALAEHPCFDTAHICTPNFTHEIIARQIAEHCRVIFIEKPGVESEFAWFKLTQNYPNTRFMMVKNNMWRNNIAELAASASIAETVNIRWIRKNCIPHPGSWFTTRALAYGGVSRDLMPHLLSLYIAMNPNWESEPINGKSTIAVWELKDIDSTEYGIINRQGTYDVDDLCVIHFGDKWKCAANWRSLDEEDSSIKFLFQDGSSLKFELGWCPEEAYHNMIIDAVANIDNSNFWSNQLKQDLWIHKQIESL
jgi:predicted dehydrogenase